MRVFSFLGVMAVLISTAHASILDKYPPNMNNRRWLTCVNNCGRDTLVCSCRAKCQIFDDCCEDFHEACPTERKHADDTMRHFGHAISCYREIKVITSCRNQTGDELSHVTTTGIDDQDLPESWTLQDIIHNVPITDVTNGISFQNMGIFKCHALESSRPRPWRIKLNRVTPKSFKDALEIGDPHSHNTARAQYLPPYIKDWRASFCPLDLVVKCPESAKISMPESFNKCPLFQSYVLPRTTTNRYMFKNMYCLECWHSSDIPFKIVSSSEMIHAKDDTFAMTMTLRTGSMVLDSLDVSLYGLPWLKGVCPLDGDDPWTNIKFTCTSYECTTYSVKTPDGMCQYERTFRFGFAEHSNHIAAVEYEKWPSITSCLIKKTSKKFMIDTNQMGVREPFHFYDKRMKMFVYVFEVNVFWETQLLSFTLSNPSIRLIHLMHTINKALKLKRLRLKTESNVRISGINSRSKSRSNFQLNPDLTSTFNLSKYLEETVELDLYAGKIIVNATEVSTSCLCLQERLDEPCQLQCSHMPKFESDSAEIKRILALSCFSGADGAHLSVLIIFLRIILLILGCVLLFKIF